MAELKASLVASELKFHAGPAVGLSADAIVVVTGPNNSGKSTLLEELSRQFRYYGRGSYKGLILQGIEGQIHGSAADFITFLDDGDLFDKDSASYQFPYGKSYKRATLEKAWDSGDIPAVIQELFSIKLEPKDRLSEVRTYARYASNDPIEHLWDNEDEEIRISKIFSRAFGIDLILDRSRGGGKFKIGDRKKLPPHKRRFTKAFRKFIDSLDSIITQGDGMRSFASIALQLLTARKSITVIDEPELFLHPPQIRHLARLICEETPRNAQVFLATHSSDFIKGVIDGANDRVVVVRLKRGRGSNTISIMQAADIEILWQDPLFRTSNALSALFHDVAVLVEGETDARFFQSAITTLYQEEHLPDTEFYSCNGKSKIHSIASALRSVNVPVVAIADLDLLSNPGEMLRLYKAMGGDEDTIKHDVDLIHKSVQSGKNQTSGRQFKSELDIITSSVDNTKPVPISTLGSVRDLIAQSSPWARLKTNGVKGLLDAKAVQALNRLTFACSEVGLLINREGELEGFCRSIPRSNKGEWLAEVLKRDLRNDIELADARSFVADLRDACVRAALS